MWHSECLDLVEFDLEIKRTFHQRLHEQRVQMEQQHNMGDNINQLVPVAPAIEINK